MWQIFNNGVNACGQGTPLVPSIGRENARVENHSMLKDQKQVFLSLTECQEQLQRSLHNSVNQRSKLIMQMIEIYAKKASE